MTAAGIILWVIAVCTIVGGLFCLGIWVGLGMKDDRRHQAANDAAEAAQLAPRPTLMLEAPPARLPGYAEAFPRPGRYVLDPPAQFLIGPDEVRQVSPPSAPNVGSSTPSTSPADVEADVRRMILDSELYMAELIAHTRHTERNHPW